MLTIDDDVDRVRCWVYLMDEVFNIVDFEKMSEVFFFKVDMFLFIGEKIGGLVC